MFRIAGTPAPQGSKNARVLGGKAIMWEASASKVKAWRFQVAQAAEEHMAKQQWVTTDMPVEVSVVFWLPKPDSARRRWPSVKPDLDKLLRSTMDGLTQAGIWTDDSRVIAVSASKEYATDKNPAGAFITVEVCA